MSPSYIKLHEQGELAARADALRKILASCTLCPRSCEVDRLKNELGTCETGRLPKVSSSFPHFGEEAPLVGRRGSGTIFFTHCNLTCSFCQNYDISHEGSGRETGIERLSAMMLALQKTGCHNINFVTPTHVTAQIVEALPLAVDKGLDLPIVYNCGGYESVETLKLLKGIVDIYMPDFKFWDPEVAARFTQAEDYPERAREALKEMHRQVGDLVIDEEGIAGRGILLRHLVMPGGLAGTAHIMKFLAEEISGQTYVNIMPQWRPYGSAVVERDVGRRISDNEFKEAIEAALDAGIERLDQRRAALFLI